MPQGEEQVSVSGVSTAIPGNLIARYYERVLGVGKVAPFDLPNVEPPKKPLCLLVEVGSGSDVPSLQQMGSRLVEAVRSEWIKRSIDPLPNIEWCQTDNSDWNDAVGERSRELILAIVCGAQGPHAEVAGVIHVPSFIEMQSSPSSKRDAWRSIQTAISQTPAFNHR